MSTVCGGVFSFMFFFLFNLLINSHIIYFLSISKYNIKKVFNVLRNNPMNLITHADKIAYRLHLNINNKKKFSVFAFVYCCAVTDVKYKKCLMFCIFFLSNFCFFFCSYRNTNSLDSKFSTYHFCVFGSGQNFQSLYYDICFVLFSPSPHLYL